MSRIMDGQKINVGKQNNMTQITSKLLVGLAGLGSFICPSILTAQDKPNVILIMTDDQGYGEMSCHGNPILQTPHLDRLHNESIRLNDFHVAPMSTPTRGQLMTGVDAGRNGAVNVSSGRTLLRPELPTMADVFTDNGYNTGIFGKWHLGDTYPYSPEYRGFKETLWFPSSHMSSVPDYWENTYFDAVYNYNGSQEKIEGYCTDIFFNKAIDWMQASAKNHKPFFAYIPLNAPHSPLQAPEKNIKEVAEAFEKSSLFKGMPENLKRDITVYLAMIRNVDENVGKLIDFLDKSKLAQNTILIFLTDNGSTYGPEYFNAGMRGSKTQLWEGGHRVPCFIRWPKGTMGKPRSIDGLTQVQDLMPTLIGLCNLVPVQPLKMDGINLTPILRGQANVPEDRMFVINYSRIPGDFSYPSPESTSMVRCEDAVVLWKRWRLVNDTVLTDLKSDPMQESNCINQYPEVAQNMRNYLYAWWDEVKEEINTVLPLSIGSEMENVTKLTSCEWVDVYVDQQQQVINGLRKNSYWNLNVEQDGEYEFELRRWPQEANIALDEGIGRGTKLEISAASVYIGNKWQRKVVNSGDKCVSFKVKLNKGPAKLHTWFFNRDNHALCGAYYVYVKRL